MRRASTWATWATWALTRALPHRCDGFRFLGGGAWLGGAMRPPPGPPRMLLALALVMHEEASSVLLTARAPAIVPCDVVDESGLATARRWGREAHPDVRLPLPDGPSIAPGRQSRRRKKGPLVDRYLVGRLPGRGMQYRAHTCGRRYTQPPADREVHRARRRLYPVNSAGGRRMIDSGRERGEHVAHFARSRRRVVVPRPPRRRHPRGPYRLASLPSA